LDLIVQTEPPQAFGDPPERHVPGEICAKGEVHSKEAHTSAVGRAAEVLAADLEPISGGRRLVEGTQVRRDPGDHRSTVAAHKRRMKECMARGVFTITLSDSD